MSYTAPTTLWSGSGFSIDNLIGGWMLTQVGPSATTTWGTQYRAIYVPIRVTRASVVLKLGWSNGSTGAGNVDIGLYDAAGTRLVSSGSVAKTATAAIKTADVTDTTIGPGLYYIGLNCDTAADTVVVHNLAAPIPNALGVLTETLGGVVLPSTASWAVDDTLAFIPIVSALLVTEVS